MKRALIIQETPGHGEVLGGFLEALKGEYLVSILAGDSYKIFGLYQKIGFNFYSYNRKNQSHVKKVRDKISSNEFDVIIFNSCPNWSETLFDLKLLAKTKSEVYVLHHSNIKNDFAHPFVKLGTSSLLAKQTDLVFSPIYNVDKVSKPYIQQDDHYSDSQFYYIGTHYEAALCMRDIDAIKNTFDLSRENAFDCKWFVAHYTAALKNRMFNSEMFIEGATHLDIYEMSKGKRAFWGTHYYKNTRYERDGMTGTYPIAVNSSSLLVGSRKFLEIYNFNEVLIDNLVRINMDPGIIGEISKSEYLSLSEQVSNHRDHLIRKNASVFS